ncbi:hypothetical protein LINPERPRIM_LOCUS30564 [Linum perenne]
MQSVDRYSRIQAQVRRIGKSPRFYPGFCRD